MKQARRALLGGLVLAGLARSALIRPAFAADAEAAAPIIALNRGLIAGMHAGKSTPFAKRFATLAPLVEGAFDIQGILQASVGPRWAALPSAQQTQLLDVFRRFTIASYVANFDSFDGEKLELLPESRNVGADQVVASQIVPSSGAPTRIDYVMRRTPAGWRAVDVLLNGSISRVAVQRSDFRSLLTFGDAGPLIKSLQHKIADLSGGALV